MTFRDSQEAFRDAIKSGRLQVADQHKAAFAGHYMYMGTDAAGVDLFKHCDTRQYLAPLAASEARAVICPVCRSQSVRERHDGDAACRVCGERFAVSL
jgi:hypothetical protein